MDKTKAKLIAMIAAIGGGLVALGYATWDQWAGLLGMMFGAQ